MRVKVEATVEELEQRGDELVKALADQLWAFNPDLSEQLEKAVAKATGDPLQFKVLRQLTAQTTAEYQRQLKGMVDDIMAVLEGRKLRKAFGDPPEEDEDEGEPEEPLEPGDYDPKNDEIVPEPEDEDEEEEEAEKSLQPPPPDIVAGKAGLSFPKQKRSETLRYSEANDGTEAKA